MGNYVTDVIVVTSRQITEHLKRGEKL